jgi:hypothetical protein
MPLAKGSGTTRAQDRFRGPKLAASSYWGASLPSEATEEGAWAAAEVEKSQ